MFPHVPSFVLFVAFFCSRCVLHVLGNDAVDHMETNDHSYMLLGVSGGLQDDFPDHGKLDYQAGEISEVKAVLIGRALVRGTKAFLDVMQKGWRQYAPEPEQPLINSNVIVSGCAEHANEYWVYAVDSRQVLSVLNNEPRFLSITPDTGLVDLQNPHTDDAVRTFALHQIHQQGKETRIPPVAILDDGTQVTNFQQSLALWAHVNDTDRTCMEKNNECNQARERYWNGIRKAVRSAEANRELIQSRPSITRPPFACQTKARLGTGPDTARINYPFNAKEIAQIFRELGYEFDEIAGELRKLRVQTAED